MNLSAIASKLAPARTTGHRRELEGRPAAASANPLRNKHLQQGIESNHFRVKRSVLRVGGICSFNTTGRTIQGFESMLWLSKGFGFTGT